jgi:UDP-glucose 4-epimerase
VPPSVVLVTGVSRHLGGRLAAELAADTRIERVIGVDTVPPPREVPLGRVEFVRADIRNPLIARVISTAAVDTVVHLNITALPRAAGGRASMKEMNVIGTMQLLAACQKSATVRRLVVKSSTAVYGSSSRDPALFTEETEPKSLPRSGYAKDAVEVEGYVRGFARRRPDVAVGVLRFTDVIGPGADSLLLRYLRLPVVPTVLGFDPRVQLLHADDALEVLRRATVDGAAGTVNVGGEGVLLLSQMARRAGRVPVPVPAPLVQVAGRAVRRAGLLDFSREQLEFLEFGRAVDTTRLRTDFGYTPRYDTVAAFDDVVRHRGLAMRVQPQAVRRAERGILDAVRAAAAAIPVGAGRDG